MLESDQARLSALHQRRIDILQPIRSTLNPNSFYTQLQELSAELSEIYSSKFELIYDDMSSGKIKPTKKLK